MEPWGMGEKPCRLAKTSPVSFLAYQSVWTTRISRVALAVGMSNMGISSFGCALGAVCNQPARLSWA
ncbi:hypothetical protein FQZ97_1121280 [compost metagenome]